MTKRAYYENGALECEATVLRCRAVENGFEILTDVTSIFPESGGQLSDTGFIGNSRVTHAREEGSEVWHLCDKAVEAGAKVKIVADAGPRLDHTQQHSGEHIVSGIVHARFGYDNVGFHLNDELCTLDLSGPLTKEELREVEDAANEAVFANVPVQVSYPSKEELKTLDYRSKIEIDGQVRIVTIPGYDICACCGTHVERTGEIGEIRIFSCVKFHEGVRLEILCGMRAYEYVNLLIEQNRKNSALLSAKPVETNAAAVRAMDELAAVKYRVSQLENELFAMKAKAYEGNADVLLFEEPMSPDALRRFADAVMTHCSGTIAIFAGSDAEGYKYALCRKDGDLRQLVKELNAVCHGRGGGKPFFAQGSVAGTRAEIEAFFAQN